MKLFLWALPVLLFPVTAMAGDDTLIRMDDPSLRLEEARGKQVNVRFSEAFVSGRLPKADYDGLVISELQDNNICLFGRAQGIEPDAKGFENFGRPEQGDICVPRPEVSLKVAARGATGTPTEPFYATDKAGCAWAWKSGGGIGLWTEDCKFDSGHWDVTYDAANDWFMLRVDNGEPYPVLRQFHVAAGEGPQSLLPELKRKGLVLDDAECVFARSTEQMAPEGWTAWDVMPIGKRKQAFDAQPSDEVPEPPCGTLGLAVDYTGFFMMNAAHPDRVLYVNLGQDGTMIDLPSVTFN